MNVDCVSKTCTIKLKFIISIVVWPLFPQSSLNYLVLSLSFSLYCGSRRSTIHSLSNAKYLRVVEEEFVRSPLFINSSSYLICLHLSPYSTHQRIVTRDWREDVQSDPCLAFFLAHYTIFPVTPFSFKFFQWLYFRLIVFFPLLRNLHCRFLHNLERTFLERRRSRMTKNEFNKEQWLRNSTETDGRW